MAILIRRGVWPSWTPSFGLAILAMDESTITIRQPALFSGRFTKLMGVPSPSMACGVCYLWGAESILPPESPANHTGFSVFLRKICPERSRMRHVPKKARSRVRGTVAAEAEELL